MMNCCPLRSLYRQYKERATVDMTDLRRATKDRPAAMDELKRKLDEDPFVLEPLPPALAEALGDNVVESSARRHRGKESSGARARDDDDHLALTPLLRSME